MRLRSWTTRSATARLRAALPDTRVLVLAGCDRPGFQARLPRLGKAIAEIGIDEIERDLGHYAGLVIDRLVISHAHPGHYQGAARFGVPVHALPETTAALIASAYLFGPKG